MCGTFDDIPVLCPCSESEAAAVVALAREALASKQVAIDVEVDDKWVANYAHFASVELQPLAAFFGGVLAQEVCPITPSRVMLSNWFGPLGPAYILPNVAHLICPDSCVA